MVDSGESTNPRGGLRRTIDAVRAWLAAENFLRHGGYLFAATALSSAGVYGFHLYASRRLGVAHYGSLASLLAAVAFVGAISTVGTTVVARLAAGFHASGETGRLRRLSDVLLWTCFAGLVGWGILALILCPQLSAFLHVTGPAAILLMAFLAAFTAFAAVVRGVLQGTQHFQEFSISYVIENFGRATLGAAGILGGLGIVGALAGQLTACTASAAYTALAVRRAFKSVPQELSLGVSMIVKTGGQISLAYFGLGALAYVDIVLAKHYLPSRQAGLYSAATLPGRGVSMIIAFLAPVILPKAAARTALRRSGGSLLFAGIAGAAAFATVPLVLFYLMPRQIVEAIGGVAYGAASPLVLPYGVAVTMLAFANIAGSYRIGIDRNEFALPLLLLVVAEIASIAFVHHSALQIVSVVLAADAGALLVVLFRITRVRASLSSST